MATVTQQRRAREQAGRRQRILDSATELAEADGWDGVTVRRLAEAIEYSQPVLYGHFPGGKAEIITAVALQGFEAMTRAMSAGSPADRPIEALVEGYLDFAAGHPAVYQAMFAQPISARFANGEVAPELRTAFGVITAAVETVSSSDDLETSAEVLWAALHGMAALEAAGRLRPQARQQRVHELIARFAPSGEAE